MLPKIFPKVSTHPLDMELQIREYMDDIAAEEWAESYLDEEAFLGSYCNGLMWIRILNPYVITHELVHHFTEKIKFFINNEKIEKLDFFHYLNEVVNALVQKNNYVFIHSIKEIRELLNF